MAPTLHPRQQQTPMSARIPPDVPSDSSISDKLGVYLRNFALWCRNGFAEQMRNNEALQGVMFRGYNSPPGANANVFMLEVGNGGQLYLAPMQLGSQADPGTPILVGSQNFKPLAGVVDGSNAPAGQVGEYVTALNLSGVALTSNVVANVTSIPLSAGDWDVEGVVQATFSAGGTAFVASVSTTSAAAPAGGSPGRAQLNAPGLQSITALSTGAVRFSTAAPLSAYLVTLGVFASGTGNAAGSIRARRMR